MGKNPEDLVPLLKNNKRLVGELLQKIDAPEIAAQLLDEGDHITVVLRKA